MILVRAGSLCYCIMEIPESMEERFEYSFDERIGSKDIQSWMYSLVCYIEAKWHTHARRTCSKISAARLAFVQGSPMNLCSLGNDRYHRGFGHPS